MQFQCGYRRVGMLLLYISANNLRFAVLATLPQFLVDIVDSLGVHFQQEPCVPCNPLHFLLFKVMLTGDGGCSRA